MFKEAIISGAGMINVPHCQTLTDINKKGGNRYATWRRNRTSRIGSHDGSGGRFLYGIRCPGIRALLRRLEAQGGWPRFQEPGSIEPA